MNSAKIDPANVYIMNNVECFRKNPMLFAARAITSNDVISIEDLE